MDAMKLLSGLLGNKSLSSGLGSQLLQGVLGGGSKPNSGGSDIAGMLGGLLGGGSGGGAASLISGLLGAGNEGASSGSGIAAGGAAAMVGGMMGAAAKTESAPQVNENDAAVLMIRAMVNAAKSDGRIDQTEQDNIVSKLGELDQAEIDFLRREFAAPLDVNGFAKTIPQGLEQQIYAISLTSIDLDSQNEANYLGQLAQGLQMNPAVCNQIHEHLGAPKIFN